MTGDRAGRAVGRRIAAARRARRLTQAELAARLDWPRDTLIHYEHGRRALSVERLMKLAAALEQHAATLLLDDPALAGLVQRLTEDDALREQVVFFVNTLDEGA